MRRMRLGTWLTAALVMAAFAAAAPARAHAATCHYRSGVALPDRHCTPGAHLGVAAGTVCVSGYSSTVRHVTEATKRRVYAAYGITHHRRGQYEIDHLVPLELGGSNDISNLWPESALPRPGFHEKDALENRLHALVCAGKLGLGSAQRSIAGNWLSAYKRYVRGHAAIVGGSAVAPGSWPSAVYILNTSAQFACTGTVIAPRVVLTAAHCTRSDSGTLYDASGYAVVAGRTDLTDHSTGEVLHLSQVLADPSYNPATVDGDLGLLILSSATSAPAIATAGAGDTALDVAGTRVYMAGWGKTDGAAADGTTTLREAQGVLQSARYCGSFYDVPFDAATELCTIDPGTFATGTCSGDSGGPLLARRADGTLVQIGVTSYGAADCSPSAPSVFARVDAADNWIRSVLAGLAPATPTPPASPAPPAAPAPPVAPSAPTTPVAAAGRYRGATSQGAAIALRVATSGHALTGATFTYRLRCRSGRSLSLHLTPLAATAPAWPLAGTGELGFNRRGSDSAGRRFRVVGAFTPAGSAHGALHVTWHSRRYGSCDSGTVSWDASR